MGDMAEQFKLIKDENKKRRANNTARSIQLLIDNGIQFETKNMGAHLIVGDYDFWPSTGLFIHRKTKERGRGVFVLLNKLGIK